MAAAAETEAIVRRFGAGPAGDGRECPGLTAALGVRLDGSSKASDAQTGGRARRGGCAPLVFVHRFMDRLHARLVGLRSSRPFFDPWHQQNQFLSEFALHRSLLSSGLVTTNASRADLFFVPFYSRLALANASAQRDMIATLRAGLLASPHWRRSGGRDHLIAVSSTRPLEELFRSSHALVQRAVLLKIELADGRHPERASTRRAPNHVALPYFVPWLADDDASLGAARPHSVCLEASNHGKLRGRVFRALRGFPHAHVKPPLESARAPWRLTRRLLCASRARMRQCKFCLVPGGLTPSSRRFYEALAAGCVPVLVADGFALPYERSTTAPSSLLPPRALSSFVLRVSEARLDQLPTIIADALPQHARMERSLRAHRAAFLYALPLPGQPAAGGAAAALVADVALRFGVCRSAGAARGRWKGAQGRDAGGQPRARAPAAHLTHET